MCHSVYTHPHTSISVGLQSCIFFCLTMFRVFSNDCTKCKLLTIRFNFAVLISNFYCLNPNRVIEIFPRERYSSAMTQILLSVSLPWRTSIMSLRILSSYVHISSCPRRVPTPTHTILLSSRRQQCAVRTVLLQYVSVSTSCFKLHFCCLLSEYAVMDDFIPLMLS